MCSTTENISIWVYMGFSSRKNGYAGGQITVDGGDEVVDGLRIFAPTPPTSRMVPDPEKGLTSENREIKKRPGGSFFKSQKFSNFF